MSNDELDLLAALLGVCSAGSCPISNRSTTKSIEGDSFDEHQSCDSDFLRTVM
jgi:hypothetical protein